MNVETIMNANWLGTALGISSEGAEQFMNLDPTKQLYVAGFAVARAQADVDYLLNNSPEDLRQNSEPDQAMGIPVELQGPYQDLSSEIQSVIAVHRLRMAERNLVRFFDNLGKDRTLRFNGASHISGVVHRPLASDIVARSLQKISLEGINLECGVELIRARDAEWPKLPNSFFIPILPADRRAENVFTGNNIMGMPVFRGSRSGQMIITEEVVRSVQLPTDMISLTSGAEATVRWQVA